MSTAFSTCDRQVEEILRRRATRVRPSGAGRWSFSLGRRPRLTATAQLSGQWITFRTAPKRAAMPDGSNPENLLQLLRYNRMLSGGAKFSLAAQPAGIRVSADIPLEPVDTADLDRPISRTIAGLKQAATLFGAKNRPAEPHAQAGRSGGKNGHCDHGQSLDLKGAFEQVGWPLSQRSGRESVVQLDVPGEFCQALVEVGDDNAVRLVTLLGDLAETGGHCQWAQAALLLEAAHWVRLARPVVIWSDTKAVCQWQSVMEDAPAAWHLQRALAALSVACRITLREWQALADESIAHKYLAVRGWL